MKQCIIIHGKPGRQEYEDPHVPSPSNHHWFPWIQKQLLLHNILTQTLEMPRPFEPVYAQWAFTLDNIRLDADTIMVGHSCGGGFILRYLSERKLSVRGIALVAPWLDPGHTKTADFFAFIPDPQLLSRIQHAHMLHSTDDPAQGIAESVKTIQTWYPAMRVHTAHHKGHYTIEEMKTPEFPELLSIILSIHD